MTKEKLKSPSLFFDSHTVPCSSKKLWVIPCLRCEYDRLAVYSLKSQAATQSGDKQGPAKKCW